MTPQQRTEELLKSVDGKKLFNILDIAGYKYNPGIISIREFRDKYPLAYYIDRAVQAWNERRSKQIIIQDCDCIGVGVYMAGMGYYMFSNYAPTENLTSVDLCRLAALLEVIYD